MFDGHSFQLIGPILHLHLNLIAIIHRFRETSQHCKYENEALIKTLIADLVKNVDGYKHFSIGLSVQTVHCQPFPLLDHFSAITEVVMTATTVLIIFWSISHVFPSIPTAFHALVLY